METKTYKRNDGSMFCQPFSPLFSKQFSAILLILKCFTQGHDEIFQCLPVAAIYLEKYTLLLFCKLTDVLAQRQTSNEVVAS